MARVGSLVILIALGGFVLACNDAGQDASVSIDRMQQTLDADAALARFTGPIGDFIVYSRTDATARDDADCPSGDQQFSADASVLQNSELWNDAFGAAPGGVLCDGRVVVINSGTDPLPDGTIGIAKKYFGALPANVLFEAPRGRIEATEISGHAALIEKPLEGYPYATASLAVIERKPAADEPGPDARRRRRPGPAARGLRQVGQSL